MIVFILYVSTWIASITQSCIQTQRFSLSKGYLCVTNPSSWSDNSYTPDSDIPHSGVLSELVKKRISRSVLISWTDERETKAALILTLRLSGDLLGSLIDKAWVDLLRSPTYCHLFLHNVSSKNLLPLNKQNYVHL